MDMEKLKNTFYKSIQIILLILVAYTTYCSIFNIHKPGEKLEPLVIILGVALLTVVFIRINKIFTKIEEKRSDIIAAALCVIFGIGCVIFANYITSIPTYDLPSILCEAEMMIQNGGNFVTEEYFAKYVNQTPITVFMYYIYSIGKFLGINDLRTFGIVINCLFMSITAFFTYLSVKKIKNHKIALTTLLFFVINPIFYIYSSYNYTDTLCMPFASIAIYLFILTIQEQRIKKQIICLGVAGIFLAIGFEIRVVIGILLVGIIVAICINDKSSKISIINIISLICGFIIGILFYNLISMPTNILKNKDLEFPPTHYIMYSLNKETTGKWNIDDYNYTFNSGTYKEKIDANIKMIKQRLKDLGLRGLILLEKQKLAVNWSNGNYDYIAKFLNVEDINKGYEYLAGNKKIFILYYCQICKAMIMCLATILILKEIIKPNEKYKFIIISMFGAFLFYMMWEVSTRYSLTFLPWLMILFGQGLEILEKVNLENIGTFRLKHINTYISICIMVCTICLLAINYPKYTKDKSLKWDKRAMQWDEYGTLLNDNITNKNIQQTFKTDKTFNCISIKFKKINNKTTNHNFLLKNSENDILVSQKFSSNDIVNDKLKTFHFKKIKPKENTKYIIEINSDNPTNESSIGLATFYQEGYDSYPDGNLKIDNKDMEADLVFQVQKEYKRPYVSKKIYIILSIIIMCIEIFAFYPYIKIKKMNKGGI